jgi:hypothetical protein
MRQACTCDDKQPIMQASHSVLSHGASLWGPYREYMCMSVWEVILSEQLEPVESKECKGFAIRAWQRMVASAKPISLPPIAQVWVLAARRWTALAAGDRLRGMFHVPGVNDRECPHCAPDPPPAPTPSHGPTVCRPWWRGVFAVTGSPDNMATS